jgi:hypothetical protein
MHTRRVSMLSRTKFLGSEQTKGSLKHTHVHPTKKLRSKKKTQWKKLSNNHASNSYLKHFCRSRKNPEKLIHSKLPPRFLFHTERAAKGPGRTKLEYPGFVATNNIRGVSSTQLINFAFMELPAPNSARRVQLLRVSRSEMNQNHQDTILLLFHSCPGGMYLYHKDSGILNSITQSTAGIPFLSTLNLIWLLVQAKLSLLKEGKKNNKVSHTLKKKYTICSFQFWK